MAVQLISYDLKKPGQAYRDLHEAIKAHGGWWHCIESVWLVVTDLTSAQVRTRLTPHLDANDRLLVAEVGSDWATWGLSDECVTWLRNHIGR